MQESAYFQAATVLAWLVPLGQPNGPGARLGAKDAALPRYPSQGARRWARRDGGRYQKDLDVQDKYGVKYVHYWFAESTGMLFCLVEAPSREAAAQVHREAHGLIADEIFAVVEGG